MPTVQSVRRLIPRIVCSAPVARVITILTHGEVPSHGLRVDLSHPGVPDRIRAAVFWRLYERAEIKLIRRYLPSDADVIELGSSFGITAAHALRKISEANRLIAVEANAGLLGPLRQVLSDPRAEVLHGAVAYSGDGPSVVFNVHPTNHLHSRLNARAQSVPVEVPRITLRQLVEQHVLDQYALIADIEGAEAGLLEHEGPVLGRCRCMIIELHATTYHQRRVDRSELVERIIELGFEKVAEERRTAVFIRR